jgi:hypothetical protein
MRTYIWQSLSSLIGLVSIAILSFVFVPTLTLAETTPTSNLVTTSNSTLMEPTRELTLREYVSQYVNNPNRYLDKIGAYDPDAAASTTYTLSQVYGTSSFSTIKTNVINDFNAGDMIFSYGPAGPRDSSNPSVREIPWRDQLRFCEDSRIDIPNTDTASAVAYTNPRCIDSNDTIDWLVLQIALRKSVKPENRFKVVLEKYGVDPEQGYVINQAVSLPTGTYLKWKKDTEGRAAYVYLLAGAKTDNGTMFSNMNPYSSSGFAAVPEIVEDIVIESPYVNGRDNRRRLAVGENAISFARGARNIKIIGGGSIRNLKFDPVRQGGRAIQCEQGCENLLVDGLTIIGTSIGISSGVHQQNQNTLPEEDMMQSTLVARNLIIDRVDVPFTFYNDKLSETHGPTSTGVPYKDRQSVLIENATITNSGFALSSYLNKTMDAISYKDAIKRVIKDSTSGNTTTDYLDYVTKQPIAFTTEKSCYAAGSSFMSTYDTSGIHYKPEAAGIFYFQGGKNVTIRNVIINNLTSVSGTKTSGGLVRGEYGGNLVIDGVVFFSKATALFNFSSGITHPTSFPAKFYNVNIRNIVAQGSITQPLLSVRNIPAIRPRTISTNTTTTSTSTITLTQYACSSPMSQQDKLTVNEWSNVRLNGALVTMPQY